MINDFLKGEADGRGKGRGGGEGAERKISPQRITNEEGGKEFAKRGRAFLEKNTSCVDKNFFAALSLSRLLLVDGRCMGKEQSG